MSNKLLLDYARPVVPTVWDHLHASAAALVVFASMAGAVATVNFAVLTRDFDAGEHLLPGAPVSVGIPFAKWPSADFKLPPRASR